MAWAGITARLWRLNDHACRTVFSFFARRSVFFDFAFCSRGLADEYEGFVDGGGMVAEVFYPVDFGFTTEPG
jgi:hypothetical protein